MDRTFLAAAVLAALLVTACGSTDGVTDAAVAAPDPTGAGPTAAPPVAEQDLSTIAVTAVDYGFEGVPAETTVGARFSLVNRSDTEVHELVAIHLNDGEDRPLTELLQLPDDERAEVGVPVGVTVALPGEDGVEPGGPWTVSQPGRYVLVCMIPQGADPASFRAQMASGADPTPDTGGGPPHAALGMVAEINVR